MKKYIPAQIEPKWQKKWQESKLYSVDLSEAKKRQYILIEFSYPSGDLHMGHWFAFAVPDILARFRRMQGCNVFFPNGFDAFGLPAENAAIKKGVHPKDWTLSNIEKMKQQFSTMGASFNWENEVITCLPEYYKWNQWIFLKMLEKGIAYKGRALANWCPNCQTVLANENVEAGKCWRCATVVIQKEVEQWFLKLTAYADKLLWTDDAKVDWPKAVRVGQNNWIGKSTGVLLDFKIENSDSKISVFTTALDTIFGATFMVLSPENPLVKQLITKDKKEEVDKYVKASKKKTELERTSLDKIKTGVFTGSYCINPFNDREIPVWVADYVLMSYGTGAVMAVPAHDARDHEFAQKFSLDIIPVIKPRDGVKGTHVEKDGFWNYPEIRNKFGDESELFDSGKFDGLTSFEAKKKMETYIEQNGFGKRTVNYHLHDWSISRQRYWGTPIPVVYCEDDGIVPVAEKDLPVELPYKVDYTPKGKPPLATDEAWVKVKCPKCGKDAKREVETMDTFVDSSWYFFRYLDPKNNKAIFDKKVVEDWLPLDIYFGGAEHTLGHTLYSRFFTKFLNDLGLITFDEYAKKRINRGLILGPDGAKMSKSRGNVVNPDEQVKQYGADAVRLYLAFIGPYAETVAPWDNSGLNGVYHFLQRVWGLQERLTMNDKRLTMNDLRIMHKTIKKVAEDIEGNKFNTAVASLMEWLNYLSKKSEISKEEYKTLLLLLAPFAPHITEELWQAVILSGAKNIYPSAAPQDDKNWSIHKQSWPSSDSRYLEEEQITIVVQVNGKVRDTLVIGKDMKSHKEVIRNLAEQSPNTQRYLDGKAVKRFVYVEGKVVNFVISN